MSMESTPEYLGGLSSKENARDFPTAKEIYTEISDWLTDNGCLEIVSRALIEDYALNRRSYLECESMNRQLGRVSKKAINGLELSPYMEAAMRYNAAAQRALLEMQSVVNKYRTLKTPPRQESKKCWKL
ncbi:hypothetical protein FACS189425_06770 [Clostridia bacterium]|nr:hypothetical protein FACS189425_06770 [Clostridia bacterium]